MPRHAARLPPERLAAANAAPADPGRDYVLYWQVIARAPATTSRSSTRWRAPRPGGDPLVVLEALRAGYPWANDRLHRFALDGTADNAAAYRRAGVAHHAYVEPEPGHGRGLLEALAERACAVVSDEFPEFFLPRMHRAAAAKLAARGVRLELVDGNGLLPLRAGEKAWTAAPHFRRQLQRALPAQLARAPLAEPLAAARALPGLAGDALAHVERVRARWPAASPDLLDPGERGRRALGALAIDHGVPPVAFAGGPAKAAVVLDDFLDRKFDSYAVRRNEAEDPSNSGFSPYLHWGFLSAHEVFARLAEREGWTPARLAPRPTGKREGWWGMSPNGEAFLEELVTWRELSYNTAHFLPAHDSYGSLPGGRARRSRRTGPTGAPSCSRATSSRPGRRTTRCGTPRRGSSAPTAHPQLPAHPLGKKFLEWTRSGEEALEFMLHVNNRWALDGRNPNSTSGITWVMGRYDHAWQERPVLGKVRPMSSAATARKIRVDGYVARYAAALPGGARREGVGDKRGDAPAPAGERRVARDRGPARGAGTAGLDVLPDA
jgi:deoxyribodipyrimidine photo-lyase